MTMRLFMAGVLGAVAMFFWSFIAHMVLPLGDAGLREIPNEKAVAAALEKEIGDHPGTYIFPGPGVGPNASREEKRNAMEQMSKEYTTRPSGLLVYHSPGSREFAFGKWLTVEFAIELFESLLAVFLLAQTRHVSFGARVGFVTVLGIAVAVWTNLSYWNWYGFSRRYTAAYMVTEAVGFICAGLVIALVLKNKPFVDTR